MTSEEHLLMIYMLARQYRAIKTLLEILRSRDIIERDDFEAFAQALVSGEVSAALLDEVRGHYLEVAKKLGIQAGS